jgi:hypothetical protein
MEGRPAKAARSARLRRASSTHSKGYRFFAAFVTDGKMTKGSTMRRLSILLAAGFVLAATAPGFAQTAAASGGQAEIKDDHGVRALYVYGGEGFKAFKPYVRELLSPKGVNPLRDNISDHIHHHALMFAVAIDGVDFWSETKGCGRQVQRGISTAARSVNGQSVSAIAADIDWTKSDGKTLVAAEKRTIELYSNPSSAGPTLASWRTRLTPPAGAESIKLTGSHYFGLGMRFVKSMDNAAIFTFADPNAASLTVRDDEKLTPSAWAACTGSVDGNTVTVAMFDHPDNPRPVLWFTMGKQFSYLSATINLWKDPMVVKAGEALDVCYGVAVWDGKATREQIDTAYRNWRKLAPGLKPEKKDELKDKGQGKDKL